MDHGALVLWRMGIDMLAGLAVHPSQLERQPQEGGTLGMAVRVREKCRHQQKSLRAMHGRSQLPRTGLIVSPHVMPTWPCQARLLRPPFALCPGPASQWTCPR